MQCLLWGTLPIMKKHRSVLQKDLEYWQIDELILEPCCALKYYPGRKKITSSSTRARSSSSCCRDWALREGAEGRARGEGEREPEAGWWELWQLKVNNLFVKHDDYWNNYEYYDMSMMIITIARIIVVMTILAEYSTNIMIWVSKCHIQIWRMYTCKN